MVRTKKAAVTAKAKKAADVKTRKRLREDSEEEESDEGDGDSQALRRSPRKVGEAEKAAPANKKTDAAKKNPKNAKASRKIPKKASKKTEKTDALLPEEVLNPPSGCQKASEEILEKYEARAKANAPLCSLQEAFYIGSKDIPLDLLDEGGGRERSFLRPTIARHAESLATKIKQGRGYDRKLGTLSVLTTDNGRYFVYDGNHRLLALKQLSKPEQEKALSGFFVGEGDDTLRVPCNIYKGVPHGLLGVLSATCNDDQLEAKLSSEWDVLQFLAGVYSAINKLNAAKAYKKGRRNAEDPVDHPVTAVQMKAALPASVGDEDNSSTAKIRSHLQDTTGFFNRIGWERLEAFVTIVESWLLPQEDQDAITGAIQAAGRDRFETLWPWHIPGRRQRASSWCPHPRTLKEAVEAACPAKAPTRQQVHPDDIVSLGVIFSKD